MNKRKILLIAISIDLLIVGFIFYLLFNREARIANLFYKYIHLSPPNLTIHPDLERFFRCYGADFLWSTAFTLTIQFILWLRKEKTYLLIFSCLLGIIYEIAQYFHWTVGSADMYDVLVYVLGSIFAIILIRGGNLYEET